MAEGPLRPSSGSATATTGSADSEGYGSGDDDGKPRRLGRECLLLLALFCPARPTIDHSRGMGRNIGLVLGDEMATREAEVHKCAIRGDSEDFAQEILLRGRIMGSGGHPDEPSLSARPPSLGSTADGTQHHFLLTCFFNSTPGVNLATRRAAILRTPPVCGLRPLRALRCKTEKVPKPTRVTRSPFFSAAVTESTSTSIAAEALVLVMPVEAAIFSTKSVLFMVTPSRGQMHGGNI